MEFTSLENIPFEELFEVPRNWRPLQTTAFSKGISVSTQISMGNVLGSDMPPPWISGNLVAQIFNNNTGNILLSIRCGPDDFLSSIPLELEEEGAFSEYSCYGMRKEQHLNSLEEIVDAWFQCVKLIESASILKLWREEYYVYQKSQRKLDNEFLSNGPDRRLEASFYISKRAKDGNYVEKRKEESGNITYVYDEKHIKARNKKKAQRLSKLAKSLKKMRTQVKKDLTHEDDRTRLAALAVALIDETFERVGNRYSAADMKHYGVTTWLVKHIKFSGSTAKIRYVGKSGIKQNKTVKSSKAVSALKKLCSGKKPSALVFELEDFTLTDNSVNQYLRPFDITAKDIRGLHANDEVRKELQKIKKSKDEKQRKADFKKAVEAAAETVGHKASTLKNQYLVPGFEEKYIASGDIIGPKAASKNFFISKRAKIDIDINVGDVIKIKEWDDSQSWATVLWKNDSTVVIEYSADGLTQTMDIGVLMSQVVEKSVPN